MLPKWCKNKNFFWMDGKQFFLSIVKVYSVCHLDFGLWHILGLNLILQNLLDERANFGRIRHLFILNYNFIKKIKN